MRKSTSTGFKSVVKDYYNSIVTTEEEQEELTQAFWTYYADHRKLTPNHQDAFENFVNACATNFDIETYEQRAILQLWYDETDAKAQRFTDIQVSHYFCYHLYMEFERRSLKY